MNGEMEAAGDVVTGAMLARAVEPSHGEAHGEDHGACLNCRATLTGHYCANCGQSAHLHRSFSSIGHDLAHGVLHFEGKIWTTLPELALRPGHLTRRYIEGERAKFVSPFALFLFSAFLMYAIFSLTGHHGADKIAEGPVMNESARTELRQEEAKADARVRRIEADLGAPGLSSARREALTEKLEDARADRRGIGVATNITRSLQNEGMNGGVAETVGRALNAAAENPEFAYYKMKANAYKFSWALILLSLPFMWLLFPFSRRFGMYDHAIYVTYSIAFMSLLFSASMLLSAVGITSGILTAALLLFAIWHMYRQFKDSYALGRAMTLIRLPLLYLFACITLSLFFTMLAVMG